MNRHAHQGTSPRRGAARTRRIVAVLALTLAAAGGGLVGARPAAAAAPDGYYTTSPAAGSLITTGSIDITAGLALSPDINTSPRIDWGDGSSESLRIECRKADGTITPDMSQCSLTVRYWDIPTGTYVVEGSHSYDLAGTYHPTLSYKSWGVPYSASWYVIAAGSLVPLEVAYDPSLFDISLSPAPVADNGMVSLGVRSSYNAYPAGTWGNSAHQYVYHSGTTVTVSATPKHNSAVTGWSHIICDGDCHYKDADTFAMGICGATTTCTVQALRRDEDIDSPDNASVRTLVLSGVAGPATTWTPCAAEGATCATSGAATVAFGAAGSYGFATVGGGSVAVGGGIATGGASSGLSGGIACTSGAFGHDPDPGVAKACYTTPAPPASGWSQCVAEGGTCTLTSDMVMAYGADGHYSYKHVGAGSPCTNDAFGGDPDPNHAKACYIMPVPA